MRSDTTKGQGSLCLFLCVPTAAPRVGNSEDGEMCSERIQLSHCVMPFPFLTPCWPSPCCCPMRSSSMSMGILLKYSEIENVPRRMGLFQVPRIRACCEVSFYLCQSGKEGWIYSHVKSLGRHKEISRQEKLDGCGARGRETFFF